MKCKAGDIAMILCGQERGSTVICRELLSSVADQNSLQGWIQFVWAPVWIVDRPILWRWNGSEYWVPWIPDKELLPIGNESTPVRLSIEETA